MSTPGIIMGLIGDGVGPSLTPPMHEAEAAAHGLKLIYRPIDIDLLGLAAHDVGYLLTAGAQLGFNAFNVTHPCKQIVIEHLDQLTDQAATIGAVNTVLITEEGLIGHNTDVTGFTSAFAQELPNADTGTVVQLGAGGAGAAVAHGLCAHGVETFYLADPDPIKTTQLATQLRAGNDTEIITVTADELPELIPQAHGIINTSPVGMHQLPGTPLPAELIQPHHWVADVIYRPTTTELIRHAASIGCAVMPGGAMAVGQAADTFQLVTGQTPDRQRMNTHFENLVAAEERTIHQ